LEPLPRSLVLETDPSFEAYASVAAYDAAGAFLEYSDDASLDIEVSGGATRSLWRSPPTFSSAAAVRPSARGVGIVGGGGAFHNMDLNTSVPTSPTTVFPRRS
jgi:hypothetical protein